MNLALQMNCHRHGLRPLAHRRLVLLQPLVHLGDDGLVPLQLLRRVGMLRRKLTLCRRVGGLLVKVTLASELLAIGAKGIPFLCQMAVLLDELVEAGAEEGILLTLLFKGSRKILVVGPKLDVLLLKVKELHVKRRAPFFKTAGYDACECVHDLAPQHGVVIFVIRRALQGYGTR